MASTRLRLSVPLVAATLGLLAACSEDPEGTLDGGSSDATVANDAGALARGVTIETTLLDLGGVVVTSTYSASFTLTNDNADPVKVTVTEPMGGDAARFSRTLAPPAPDGLVEIPGGAAVTVTVSVSPTEVGLVRTNLLVDSCLGECPVLVEVVARGVESGLECATPVDFGLVFPGRCGTRRVTCENVGNTMEEVAAVERLDSSDDAFLLFAPILPVTLAPGEQLGFDVEMCPSAAEPLSGAVRVTTAAPFTTEQTVELVGRGGGPLLTCGPLEIDFGAVGVGGLARAAFTCVNDGFDAAGLELSLASGSVFSVGAATASIAPGTRQVIEVTVAPTGAGAVQDTLTVVTNDGATPELEVALSAEGVTSAPCALEVAPGEVDFGIVNEGDLHAVPIRLRNAGANECLLGEAIVTMGAQHFGARRLPVRGQRLAPSETYTLELTFTPRDTAILTGEVDVTVQNVGTGRVTIPVSGQGGPAGLVPEPVALDFGAVPTDCAAPVTRTITVRRISATPSAVNNVSIVSDAPDVFSLASEVTATQLGFYETLSFEVAFDPDAVGDFTGQARIFFGLPRPVVVPLLGEGRAVANQVDVVDVREPKVDVLFVIDDSQGNAQVQAALAAAAPAFAARLEARQADLHIGVVTTDMQDEMRQGRLVGSPTYLDSGTSDLGAALAARIDVGTEGSGTEQGLAASLAALTPPLAGLDNAGFRRADADLVVVYVSSEDDQSPQAASTRALLETFRGLAGGQRLLLAALVGPPDADCDGPSGSAVSGARYATLIGRHEDGLLLTYCDDAAANLDALADRLLGGDVGLTGTPVIDQITVSIGGVDVPATAGAARNWGYDLASNTIVFFDARIDNGDRVEVRYPVLCVPGTCGDGQTDPGEFCDDMNDVSTDACIECRNAVCGDGITQVGVEECDDGNLVDTDACRLGCAAARCGDGVVQAGVELCDDGNTVGGDGCPAACRFYQSSGLTSHAFQELTNGSPLVFSDEDDGRTSVTLPFVFELGGIPTSSLAVSVNGFVSTQSIDSATSFDNAEIPNPAAPNAIIAPWWDDLVIDSSIPGGAATSTAVLGLPPNRQYVIEWRDLRSADHSSNNHRRWTFQLALEETTNNVIFRYADTETRGRVPTAVTASAGIEDGAGAFGFEALGCSPTCQGPQRQGNRPDGFPQQTEVILSP